MDGTLAGFGRVVIFVTLVIYYNMTVGLSILIHAVTHLFSESNKIKIRPAPPDILSDPKFGYHKYIILKGKKIHYVESGDPSKELLFFLHGFPEFWYSWRYQLPIFSKDYWCVAIDLPGFGYSEKSHNQTDYSLSAICELIAEMIRTLGREQCVLVGHDWGAMIAWRLVSQHPGCVRTFVTLAAPPQEILTKMFWQDWIQFRSSWYVCLFKCFWVPENWLACNDLAEIANMVKHKNSTDMDIECYKYIFGKPGAITPTLNYYRANIKCNLWLPDVQQDCMVPNLSILSDDDAYVSVSCVTALKKSFKNTQVIVIQNAGHFMHQEKHEEVNQIISKYLNEEMR